MPEKCVNAMNRLKVFESLVCFEESVTPDCMLNHARDRLEVKNQIFK